MAGTNPYIKHSEAKLPTKKFKITYVEAEHNETLEVEVEPDRIPYGRTGRPGSLLDIGLAHGVDIEHTCGGVCACSTCHVVVKQGLASCNEETDDEMDQLEEAPGLTIQSRLGCQCIPDGTMDLVVEVPSWNRNAVKETPHH